MADLWEQNSKTAKERLVKQILLIGHSGGQSEFAEGRSIIPEDFKCFSDFWIKLVKIKGPRVALGLTLTIFWFYLGEVWDDPSSRARLSQ